MYKMPSYGHDGFARTAMRSPLAYLVLREGSRASQIHHQTPYSLYPAKYEGIVAKTRKAEGLAQSMVSGRGSRAMINKARILEDWLKECGHEYEKSYTEDNQGNMVVSDFRVYHQSNTETEICTEIHLDLDPKDSTLIKLWSEFTNQASSGDGFLILTVDLSDPDSFANINEVIYEGPDANVNWQPADFGEDQ